MLKTYYDLIKKKFYFYIFIKILPIMRGLVDVIYRQNFVANDNIENGTRLAFTF